MQVVSGAPLTAFWGATYLWDLLNFTIPVAGLLAPLLSCQIQNIQCRAF